MTHQTGDIPALMMGLGYMTAHILKTLLFPVELVSIMKGILNTYRTIITDVWQSWLEFI